MTELIRRSFIKGLFLAAASPLIASPFNIVQASTLNLATVDITYFNITGTFVNIQLNDKTDKTGIFRAYVDNTLQYINMIASEPNGDYNKMLMIQDQVRQLQPLRESRQIYDYSTISDSRNHTPYMQEKGIKALDCWIRPIGLTGHLGFRFGYDPTLV